MEVGDPNLENEIQETTQKMLKYMHIETEKGRETALEISPYFILP